MPDKMKKLIDLYVAEIKKIYGHIYAGLFYMALMPEEITDRIQM